MIRLLFLIRSLDPGGAERQLIELVRGFDPKKYSTTVVTLYRGAGLLRDVGIGPHVELVSLEKRGRWDVTSVVASLRRVVRERRPDIIHGYMPVANELALLVGRAVGAKVIWGIRTSYLDFKNMDSATTGVVYAGRVLSRWADLIIANSTAGRDFHASFGYPRDRIVVIPNGFDVDRFVPDPPAGARLRAEWAVAPDERLIGIVARLDPAKDHTTFLQSAAIVAGSVPGVRFVCVGDGPVNDSGYELSRIRALAESLGLGHRIIWAGRRSDVVAVYNALDVLVSSSRWEGFSNVIGEAMACGLRCVVTDVGDSAHIVGATGSVVPAQSPVALAKAITAATGSARERCLEARERIVTEFSHQRLVTDTSDAMERLLA